MKFEEEEEGTEPEREKKEAEGEWVYLSEGMIIIPPKAVEKLKKI